MIREESGRILIELVNFDVIVVAIGEVASRRCCDLEDCDQDDFVNFHF